MRLHQLQRPKSFIINNKSLLLPQLPKPLLLNVNFSGKRTCDLCSIWPMLPLQRRRRSNCQSS